MCGATPSSIGPIWTMTFGHRQRALEDPRAVRLGEDRLLERMADFAPVDVERGDELDVAAAIAADRLAHDAFERSAAAIR